MTKCPECDGKGYVLQWVADDHSERLPCKACLEALSGAGWYLCDELLDDGLVRQRPRYWTGIRFYDDNGMCMSSVGLSNFRRMEVASPSPPEAAAGELPDESARLSLAVQRFQRMGAGENSYRVYMPDKFNQAWSESDEEEFRRLVAEDRSLLANACVKAAAPAHDELDELRRRMATIEAAAKADADDLAKMRDGTKLTRNGLVQVLAWQQEELTAAESALTAAKQDADHYRRLYDNLKSNLPDEHDVGGPEDAIGYFRSMCGLLDKREVPSEDFPTIGLNPTSRLQWVFAQLTATTAELARVKWERDWLPIESAPKDETWVALWCEDGGVKAGYWGNTYFGRDPAWITYAHRSESEEIWPLPTHWQSLPAPPAAALAKGAGP